MLALLLLALLLLALLPQACTGIFQEPLPERVDSFERETSGPDLRIGFGQADITPDGPCYLAGFSLDRVSTGVHSPLAARAMVLQLADMKIAIVGVDSLGLQRDDVEWIKDGLVGFQKGCVFLCSSHTHAGPDPVGFWGPYFLASGRDPAYVGRLRARIAEAVAAAERAARPAELWRGEARLPAEGLLRNSNRPGLFDRRLTVLQARDPGSRKSFGALLHVGCHPEVLRRHNTEVSADYVGELCKRWQAAGLGPAVFVNGALGAMVSPQPHGKDGLEEMGSGLFAACQRAVAGAVRVPATAIEVRRRDLYLPLTSPGLQIGVLTVCIPRPAYEGMMRTTVGYLRLGSVEVACVPGEMEPALAARIRQIARRPNLLLFGLVDDEVGYLMRAVDAHDRLFAYERGMSPCVDAGERVQQTLVGR